MTANVKSQVMSPAAAGWLNPRGYLGTAVMLAIPGGLGFGILMKFFTGMPILQALGAGIFFGVFWGLITAIFLKGIAVQYRCPWSGEIAGRLQIILAEIGYHPESTVANTVTFKPSFQTGLLAGRITISGHDDHIDVFGPSRYVRKVLSTLDRLDVGESA
jgi:hypothetical protein